MCNSLAFQRGRYHDRIPAQRPAPWKESLNIDAPVFDSDPHSPGSKRSLMHDTTANPTRSSWQGPVPPDAPLAMPTQDLHSTPRKRDTTPVSAGTAAGRLVMFGGSTLLTGHAILEMHAVVATSGITVLEWVFLGLFSITFCWIALAACSAVAGILPVKARQTAPARRCAQPVTLTAIVMPVYNEDPASTCASLEVMATELARCGLAEHYEIFLLSDTTEPTTWLAETLAFTALRERLTARIGDSLPVWYRRRARNTARKAGNLRDFVERWGNRYDHMIVLDADSLISADTLATLTRHMQADDTLGILQSVPALANGQALLPRLQQFAGQVYGPVVARGLAAWQGREGNYWGHNAIIRVRAFAEATGLPTLPGRRPLGGEILSHDFVEAALIRKAGWSVRMLPDLAGSWEDSPPSLLDIAARDRRWAQGNVQHLAILPTRGLAWPSRVHFAMGIMSYAASPLWLMLIVIGLVLSAQAALFQPSYFSDAPSLFPRWPYFDSERMTALFVFSLGVLLVPKGIGVIRVLCQPSRRRAHGGTPRFLVSVVFELLMSALYAPIMMLMQSRQLAEIACGLDSGWSLQQRSGSRVAWLTLLRRHYLHMTSGVALTVALWWFIPQVLPWMLPVLAGLLLALPLSRLSGDTRLGQWLRRRGLLIVAEEVDEPASFEARRQAISDYAGLVEQATLRHFVHDAAIRHRHYDAAERVTPAGSSARGAPDPVWLTTQAKVMEARSPGELLDWLDGREFKLLLDRATLADYMPRTSR